MLLKCAVGDYEDVGMDTGAGGDEIRGELSDDECVGERKVGA